MTPSQALKEIGSGQGKNQDLIGFVCYFRGCIGDCERECVCVSVCLH